MIAGSLTTVYMYCYIEQSCCYALKCTAYSQLSVQNSYMAAGIGPPFCLCLRWSLRSLIFHLALSWALVHSLSSFPYCRMSEACFYIFLFCVSNPPFQLIFQNSTYRNNLFSLFFMHRINPEGWQPCKHLSDLSKMAASGSRSQGNVNFNYKLYFHMQFLLFMW